MSRGAVRTAVLALGLAVVACSGSGEGTGPADDRDTAGTAGAARLEELIARHVEAETEGADERPRDLSREAFEARLDRDREVLAELRALEPAGLTRAQRIDRLALIGVLDAGVRVAEIRRSWENDPGMYLSAARLSVPEAPADPVIAAAELADRLLAAPPLLRQARRNVGRPPLRFTEEALFSAERTLESLDAGVPALVVRAGEGSAAGTGLADAWEATRPVLAAHVTFLRDEILPRSDGDWRLGREGYAAVLQHRWYMQEDADSILARGWAAFEETEAMAFEVAERIAPGRGASDWVSVYEQLKDEHPPADGIKAAYQAQMDAAQEFVLANRIVTLPEGEHVVTVDTPPAMRRSSPFGTFNSVDPFGDELQGRLVLTPIEDWLSEEQRRERMRSHHDAWIPIIAVHEAYPGHHVQALKVRENPRDLRRVIHESILSEGWGLYTEQLMFDYGFLQGDDVMLTMLRNRLWRAARVILDASLHTGRMTFEEAVDFMVERVRFERYAAELEVGMYPRRPTYVLGYLIGMQEIAAIHRDWIAAHGEPQPPSELWDAFLVAGGLPPALVRVELLNEPLEPLEAMAVAQE